MCRFRILWYEDFAVSKCMQPKSLWIERRYFYPFLFPFLTTDFSRNFIKNCLTIPFTLITTLYSTGQNVMLDFIKHTANVQDIITEIIGVCVVHVVNMLVTMALDAGAKKVNYRAAKNLNRRKIWVCFQIILSKLTW